MLVLEYKVKGKASQYKAIEAGIRTVQFVGNKCWRYSMDAPKEAKINYAALSRYSTELRKEFLFVKDLNSIAVQAAALRSWLAISRFYGNCKAKKPGKKGFPRFQKDNARVEYKTSGWQLHSTRRITISDKKGIGLLKLLGKWDIHTYPIKSIKRVRLVRRADGYYCQLAIDVECKEELQPTKNAVGLEVGLEYFYTDSNGHTEENPR
ncbi:transposase [Microseira wollei NIES-4236]|uniref:Transposase n=1 Tax=Microseira wollei NIES-4236 TaxID=2530354 RepID=A0AAV3XRT1_9CYAN|nr:transposase [Microseira wollei]GET43090.1 transposase [Microseira wollei NIES-4236]